ncbi:fumarylacetoacetate hydrolase family protein [Alcaligenaceae bacterium]|nr:fumarylacetoacetate hydrolase family protein [Alcaligenaceae bacterium]
MKFCTFTLATPLGAIRRVGIAHNDMIVDAAAARTACLEHSMTPQAAMRVGEAQVPSEMLSLIGSGPLALEWAREALDHIATTGQETTSLGTAILHKASGAQLLAPIPRPPGIACFITWSAHIEASRDNGFAMLNFPDSNSDMRAYYKANPDAVEGPGTTIPPPAYASETDVECEMAAVIGVGGRDFTIEQARSAIVGYTIFNDVSYRDIQSREMAFGLGPAKGKDADHSNVLGPWLVTADEVGDPQALKMAFIVNGATINQYDTSRMTWGFADLVAYLSRAQTLAPGHIVTSGAFPGGCGLDAGIALKSGDVVEMRIEKLGSLVSTIG